MKTVIIGAGTYGQVYLHYLKQLDNVEVVGFIDEDDSKQGSLIDGVPVLGKFSEIKELSIDFQFNSVFCSIGNNNIRVDLLSKASSYGFNTPNFIHSSVVCDSVIVENHGIYMLPGVVVMPKSTIGRYVMISMGAYVAHHTTLEEGVFISTGANIGAGLSLCSKSFVGIGATVMTGVNRVGLNSVVGAGAVVISDIPDGVTVVGNPARIIKR